MGDFLRQELKAGADLDLVTAYFTIYAYGKLRNELDQLGRIRLLFGEAAFIKTLDPDKKDGAAYVLRDDGLSLANGLSQRHLANACATWIREKAEVKSVTKDGFLHGKMSHIRRGEVSAAILGSSNFTTRGLGLASANNNVELNLIVRDDRDRDNLREWFEELWNDTSRVEDVKQQVLNYLGQVYADQSPQFVYYKTLYELFRRFIEDGQSIDENLRQLRLPDTGIWKALYSFQRDGAKSAINKIKQFNGCILADSVGLGKTYTALAVIKYFELRNDKVLVLCPKKLRRNWTKYTQPTALNPFQADRFGFHVLHHTDLSRTIGESNGLDLGILNWGAYDLVVIDESHNFRNNKLATQRPGDEAERRTRYQRLMDDIISAGARTKVLLLSATPVNNQLADLRNQISFIAGGDVARDATADAAFAENLGINSVKETTRLAQGHFTTWSKRSAAQRKTRDLIAAIGGDFFKLLDGLSLARSRRQIGSHYAEEMRRLGGFPHRPAPKAIHAPIDSEKRYFSFEQLDAKIGALRLALYHPTSFLRKDLPDGIRDSYQAKILGGFTQEGREKILIAMMKINFLKRLESSVDSFRLTLERTIRKINDLESRIIAFEQHQDDNPDLDYDTLTPDDPDFEDEEFTIGGRRRIHLGHLELADWLKAVRDDRTQLQFLHEKTKSVTAKRDGKLAELKQLIAAKASHPTTNRDGKTNRKVLVFTAFADTARYLHENIATWARRDLKIHTGLVCGDGGNDASLGRLDFDDILTNFSPVAKERDKQAAAFPNQREEIDLLIATDCISEGQNLQDCDLLVNYDIHWNPVRIIQRFGRIDRIGSRNDSVQLVNFWPVADLDRYLNVKHRVEARMALVDLAASQTDNLLDTTQLEDLIKDDLLFRDRQLKRLKDEVLDLEDLDDSVSLTDFSLDEFRQDLLNFLQAHKAELERAPLGLYAVVPPAADIPMAQPGVIYCLRQKIDAAAPANERINPLAPHYLVYVHDTGEVRLAFVQAKTVLNLFRSLALGKAEPYEELCRLFDRQTAQGGDMRAYSRLIASAVESISTSFQQRLADSLQHSRDFILPLADEQPQADSAFELVTWLVLLNEQ
ncbi:MAG: DEAD/DEAH box helicase family protein [Opitutaceae bacterium]|nr:DEAD/DEAH box helicase family protein [Opitutaceae bacterium]